MTKRLLDCEYSFHLPEVEVFDNCVTSQGQHEHTNTLARAHNAFCIRLAVCPNVSARRGLSRWADCSGSLANGFRRAYRASRLRVRGALPGSRERQAVSFGCHKYILR